MKTIAWAGITISVLLASIVTNGCRPDLSHQRRMSLQSVQALPSGSIADCEERYGEVFVSIGDKHGDCHVFLLEHSGVSREDAILAIKAKKADLERKRAGSPDP